MRLIDADAFIKMMEEKCDQESTLDPWVLSVCRGGVKIMPTVDAVPAVRCRDCEHKDRESGFCHGRGWPMQLVPDDGFCDKGKDGERE